MKILIVNSSRLQIDILTGLIEEKEIQIDVALSFMDTIEKIIMNEYDGIILNANLPHNNGLSKRDSYGLELLPVLACKCPNSPICILEIQPMDKDKVKSYEIYIKEYVKKIISYDFSKDIEILISGLKQFKEIIKKGE